MPKPSRGVQKALKTLGVAALLAILTVVVTRLPIIMVDMLDSPYRKGLSEGAFVFAATFLSIALTLWAHLVPRGPTAPSTLMRAAGLLIAGAAVNYMLMEASLATGTKDPYQAWKTTVMGETSRNERQPE